MKVIMMAGTPGAGKTAILSHTLPLLLEENQDPVVAKIDCLATQDGQKFKKIGVPTIVGLSKDMCPDHFMTFNLDTLISFAKEEKGQMLIIETAGLCHRCAPYTHHSLGICVIDATTGPHTPEKVGPFLTSADIVVVTKGDVISQAEREIFRENIIMVNPQCRILELNGLTGMGCGELANIMQKAPAFPKEGETLRHQAPLSICTLCTGERRVAQKYHRGILRRIDGFQWYKGE